MNTLSHDPAVHSRRLACALLLLAMTSTPSSAWINDQNENRIDDQIERVETNGLIAAHVNGDLSGRRTIALMTESAPFVYGVYVGFDHPPTATDAQLLAAAGLSRQKTYTYIPYIRAQATYAQILAAAAIPGVTRVEAIPMMYSTNHYGARVLRARDSRGLDRSQNEVLFPSVWQDLGLDGKGIVIGVLDTGVNDAPDSVNVSYPGHEGLTGKFLGGGAFFAGDPALNTPLGSSWNPSDHGAAASSYHATHVAGTALGRGGLGSIGYYAGVAPAARLVDCKVLSDAGVGFGSADGVEWCIFNRTQLWPGLSGADTIYRGIDVLSLSLGGTSNSDGTDANAQMMNAAVDAGLVVCIATGNDDSTNYMASPASADKVISVGASSHNKTLARTDDLVTIFSNEGPRRSDRDADRRDEMKPTVVGPGAGILSADGDFTTDGAHYKGLSGTSMATPHISGVCALIRQANPNLTPLQVRSILENTAERGISSVKGNRPNDPFGVDPNYNPGCGWGEADAYAACKEALNSTSGVQVVLFRPVARLTDGVIDVRWTTQREFPFLGFNVYRAPDVNGAPGPFTQINTLPIAPTGHSGIAGTSNRTPYVYVDGGPLVVGETYWYRVAWLDLSAAPHFEPFAPTTFGSAPRVATAYYSLSHNEPENDLLIKVGTSTLRTTGAPDFVVLGPGLGAQDSSRALTPPNAGSSTIGNVEHFWSIGFSNADGVGALLPPSNAHPWFLNVAEGGFVNRTGRLNTFSMFVNDLPGGSSGVTYTTNTPTPRPTVETTEANLWIPETALPLAVASLRAESVAEGVRLSLQVLADPSGLSARVLRSVRAEFSSASELTDEAIPMTSSSFDYVDATAEAGLTHYYWIVLQRATGGSEILGPVAGELRGRLTFARPAHPNPVRTKATFEYVIGADVASGGPVEVMLDVFDMQGRLVRALRPGRQGPGQYQVGWDAATRDGARVPPGIYAARFRAGAMQQDLRVVVIR